MVLHGRESSNLPCTLSSLSNPDSQSFSCTHSLKMTGFEPIAFCIPSFDGVKSLNKCLDRREQVFLWTSAGVANTK